MPIKPRLPSFHFISCRKVVLLLVCLAILDANRLLAQRPNALRDALPDDPGQKFAVQAASEDAAAKTISDGKPVGERRKKHCEFPPCFNSDNWYLRFVTGPQDTPLTVRDKGWLAARNFADPFNAVTVLAEGAISVGADSHSAYGPGMPGYGRYIGVSFTQDLTGEFFNTFLIPSIVHQDQHYHRRPQATYPRRMTHAITQVVWTQGDNGRGMLNYGNVVGFAIDDEIGNLYIPSRRTNVEATAQRYAIGIATAPIGNIISEFLPDVARHVHVQIVVVQRIINRVANTEQ